MFLYVTVLCNLSAFSYCSDVGRERQTVVTVKDIYIFFF